LELSVEQLKRIIEGAIMASDKPLNIEELRRIFDGQHAPTNKTIQDIIQIISDDYKGRGIELKEVANGFRFQVCQELSPWIAKLWQERPVKYSRTLLETLALIVYCQPITRPEIEEIRRVSVSSTVMKTLQDREWIRVEGYKEVPGKPAKYVTTKQFLDDFNLKSLAELPKLAELKDLGALENKLNLQLNLEIMS
jgi:segregation and condensation protein B